MKLLAFLNYSSGGEIELSNPSMFKFSPRYREVRLHASLTSRWLVGDKDKMKFLSQQHKNKSATHGAQVVPWGMPTTWRYTVLLKHTQTLQ